MKGSCLFHWGCVCFWARCQLAESTLALARHLFSDNLSVAVLPPCLVRASCGAVVVPCASRIMCVAVHDTLPAARARLQASLGLSCSVMIVIRQVARLQFLERFRIVVIRNSKEFRVVMILNCLDSELRFRIVMIPNCHDFSILGIVCRGLRFSFFIAEIRRRLKREREDVWPRGLF
jgi:hypothetical protein